MTEDSDGVFVVREAVALYGREAPPVQQVDEDASADGHDCEDADAGADGHDDYDYDYEAKPEHQVAAADSITAALEAAVHAANVPAVSRKVTPRLRTRRTRPRSKTIALKRLTREELRRGALANPPVDDAERPTQRSECKDGPRPCPWVACKHHLYLDINPRTGSIKINFPDLEPWELQQTCALDVADNGGLTLEEIGLITNLTRERVRQVEVRGLLTLRARSNALR
jgi:hypothetical protein